VDAAGWRRARHVRLLGGAQRAAPRVRQGARARRRGRLPRRAAVARRDDRVTAKPPRTRASGVVHATRSGPGPDRTKRRTSRATPEAVEERNRSESFAMTVQLELSVLQRPRSELGFVAGFAVTDELVIAAGGTSSRGPTILASSNVRHFEPRSTPRELGFRDVLSVGDAVWVCGEYGQLAASQDAGA